MVTKPKGASFQLTGTKMSNGHEWVVISLRFEDEELGCGPSIEIECPVRSDDNRSIASAQKEAAQYAVAVLRDAADLLENASPAKLIEMDSEGLAVSDEVQV